MVLVHMTDKNGTDRIKFDATISDFSFGITAAIEKIISAVYLQKIHGTSFIGFGGTMAGAKGMQFHKITFFHDFSLIEYLTKRQIIII